MLKHKPINGFVFNSAYDFFKTYLILYACKYLPDCMSIAMCIPSAQRGQEIMMDPLELG